MKFKKKGLLFVLTSLTLGTLSLGLSSCNKNKEKPKPVDQEKLTVFNLKEESGKNEFKVAEEGKVVLTDFEGVSESDLSIQYSSSDRDVVEVDENGKFKALRPGVAEIIALDSDKGHVNTYHVKVVGEGASGFYDYSGKDVEEKFKLLGALEKYAQDEFLTGLPFAGNGKKIMYHERVQKPVETYVKGYGFGVLTYGKLTAPLEGETNPNYKYYYHNAVSEDPHNVNIWNANTQGVTDLADNICSSYFTYELNEEKNDKVIKPLLSAKDKFVAVKPSGEGAEKKANTFKIYVKAEGSGLKYNTNSQKFKEFDGREVKLDDYLTPFKCLFTQKNNLFRGSEMLGETYKTPIKGAQDCWNESKDGYNDAAFAKLGVKAGRDEEGSFIQVEFSKPQLVENFEESFSSQLYMPLPYEFIEKVGGAEKYGCFSENGDLTPVDTTLGLGPYTLEYYEKDKAIVYKRNPYWIKNAEKDNMYHIEGIHTAVITAAKTDTEAVFKEFLANKLDSSSIPGTFLEKYLNDPRTTQIPEYTTWKFNFNALNQKNYDVLFGKDGTIYKNSDDKKWNIKPIMSNNHFLNGLYYSVNREQFAASQNMSSSQSYLCELYHYKDSEGKEHKYHESQAHKDAIKHRYPNKVGFNPDAARLMFKLALQEEVAKGNLKIGTKENPTVIKINAKYGGQNVVKSFGEPLTKYMIETFNSVDPRFRLEIENVVAGSKFEDVYDAMQQGQFDIAIGAISGMENDPIGFFQILRSDNVSGFTLNFGPDTSKNDGKLFYDGKLWSFDALQKAGSGGGVFVENGEVISPYVFEIGTKKNEEGEDVNDIETIIDDATQSVTFKNKVRIAANEGFKVKVKSISIEDYATNSGSGTGEVKRKTLGEGEFTYDENTNLLTFSIDNSLNDLDYGPGYAKYNNRYDVYIDFEITLGNGEVVNYSQHLGEFHNYTRLKG